MISERGSEEKTQLDKEGIAGPLTYGIQQIPFILQRLTHLFLLQLADGSRGSFSCLYLVSIVRKGLLKTSKDLANAI